MSSHSRGHDFDLGPCCCCEQVGATVRNVVMLSRRGPVPGQGWGCLQCGLPPDGACYVACDACWEYGRKPRLVIVGNPTAKGRMPIESLPCEPFDHDMTRHPGEH